MIKTYKEAITELATTIWLEYNTDARLAMEIVAFIYSQSIEQVRADIQEILSQSDH